MVRQQNAVAGSTSYAGDSERFSFEPQPALFEEFEAAILARPPRPPVAEHLRGSRKRVLPVPKTAGGFLRALERTKRADAWNVATLPAEELDDADTRIVFWLKADTERTAYVAHEYGRMLVTLQYDYWFELDRITQHYPWQEHIRTKSWCSEAHLNLLDELSFMFRSREDWR